MAENYPSMEEWDHYRPALIRLQRNPPSPLGRRLLWVSILLLVFVMVWAVLGKLDVVAVAPGQLVPNGRLKIIQPAEAGIVREILVHEGQQVSRGQVLMRMEALEAEADLDILHQEIVRVRMALRCIAAQLEGRPMKAGPGDPEDLFSEVAARCDANREAQAAALAEARSELLKAKQERIVAQQQKRAIVTLLPTYKEEEQALARLAAKGHSAKLQALEKRRKRIEQEQELAVQRQLVSSAEASIKLWEQRIESLIADYRQQLHEERARSQTRLLELSGRLKKLRNRHRHLVLRAPEDGTVKDLATHTNGTVVQPGTILATLVPQGGELEAEVWIANTDVGFVRSGLPVQLKLATYPFQKYGMLQGTVVWVSADAKAPSDTGFESVDLVNGSYRYRALVRLDRQALESGGAKYPLAPGMQVQAEIVLGSRSVADYLLSPVQAAWREAGRER